MSASNEASCILLSDNEKKISTKMKKYAFSGGRETEKEQRELGANPDVDVSYQYLRFFLEDDDELEQIRQDYASGKMLTGEIKNRCSQELWKYVHGFQERRAKVTEETVGQFMEIRPLLMRGQRSDLVIPLMDEKKVEAKPDGEAGDGKMTKNQQKKLEKLRLIEEKKAQKAKEKEEKAKAAAEGAGSGTAS